MRNDYADPDDYINLDEILVKATKILKLYDWVKSNIENIETYIDTEHCCYSDCIGMRKYKHIRHIILKFYVDGIQYILMYNPCCLNFPDVEGIMAMDMRDLLFKNYGDIKRNKINKDLVLKIAKNIDKSLKDFNEIIDGERYGITDFKETGWEKKGDYQVRVESGKLCCYDSSHNIIAISDFYLENRVIKGRPHYGNYEYEYENIGTYEIEKIITPEKVIPKQVEFKRIYFS